MKAGQSLRRRKAHLLRHRLIIVTHGWTWRPDPWLSWDVPRGVYHRPFHGRIVTRPKSARQATA